MSQQRTATPHESVSVNRTATVLDTANKMAHHGVSSVTVLDDGIPMGVVTDRDLVLRCICEGRNPETTNIEEILGKGSIPVRVGHA